MPRVIGIGQQDFTDIRKADLFYIDKTHFIKEWWENQDSVTLLTRPRRFGKTLTMSMLEKFFSVKYAGDGEIPEDAGNLAGNQSVFRKCKGTNL